VRTHPEPSTPSAVPDTCIIGAGPAGLAVARALAERELAYTHLERHSAVGGIWDIDNPGTPMYDSAHFISSRTLSGFGGFPMPEWYADYPPREDILAYLRSFADAYGLTARIDFEQEVVAVEQNADGNWSVTRASGISTEHRDVVVCSGAQWHPNQPTLPGRFTGEVRHSITYRSAAELSGKRVLIVGAGNSGVDIACDAAANAHSAAISMRRGYWIIPKHLFGKPVDVIGETGPHLPARLESRIFGRLLRLLEGDLRAAGLQQPDHRLLESHPIVNSQMLHHLRHGDLVAKPDIVDTEGPTVRFADGSEADYDLIILATGYEQRVPFAQGLFGDSHHPDLYLSAFSRQHPGLHAVGFIETNSGAYQMFDLQAQLIASYIDERDQDTASARRFSLRIAHDRPDLTGGLRFVASPRHQGYVHAPEFKRYLRKIAKQLGWRSEGLPPRVAPEQHVDAATPTLEAVGS
jgi:cation diffusion facilitator CzcD-associated flavoprotein CzcO